MNDLTFLKIKELRKGLDAKKFSSVELTKAYLERIEEFASLNAFITICKDEVLKEAEAADQEIAKGLKRPLLGIPVAIKDIILTKGIRSTAGSRILENFIPPYDATVVRKLKEAGALIIGKTNLDEFAMGGSTETSFIGPCKNPWDTERVAGGSSGGSAVAVSTRMAPVGFGTDTGGSIRQPASFCNLFGIRPTYGRVSRYGVVAFASSLDQVGAFASNTEDLATVLEIISGHDENDSTSMDLPVPNFSALLSQPIKGLKIGIPKEFFITGMEEEVKQTNIRAISELANLGAEIIDISLPHTEAAIAVYYIIAPAEAASNLARYDGVRYGHRTAKSEDLMDLYCKTRTEGFNEEVKRRIIIGTYVLSSGYYDAYYLKAQKVRTLLTKDFREAYEKCDLIACPTSPMTAFKIGEKVNDPLAMYLCDVFMISGNMAGLSGMSIPCGFDSKGLPIGLQLIAKPFDEGTILRVSSAYEAATPYSKEIPALLKEA